MTRAFRVFYPVIILLLICASSADGSGPAFSLSDSSLTRNGVTMHYSLAVHDGIRRDAQPVTLVLALHYGGKIHPGLGRRFMQNLILPAFRSLPCIIVAPVTPLESGWANATTDSLVMALLQEVRSRYRIDPGRILVTGFSRGGIGTWYFAATHPDVFTAAIPISGYPPDLPGGIRTLPPTCVIHSTGDALFPVQNVQGFVKHLQSKKLDVTMKRLDGVSHYATSAFVAPLKETLDWLAEKWL